jgi:hypothetical protein
MDYNLSTSKIIGIMCRPRYYVAVVADAYLRCYEDALSGPSGQSQPLPSFDNKERRPAPS